MRRQLTGRRGHDAAQVDEPAHPRLPRGAGEHLSRHAVPLLEGRPGAERVDQVVRDVHAGQRAAHRVRVGRVRPHHLDVG